MKDYYLAYGSNLSLEQMKYRCKDSELIGTTILEDFQLVFKGRGNGYAYLTIEENVGSYVPIGIYKISYFDRLRLNKYEGYPESYEIKYHDIVVGGIKEKAMIYIMNSNMDYHLPTKEYMDICKKGYEDFGFNEDLIDKALSTTKEKMGKQLIKTI